MPGCPSWLLGACVGASNHALVLTTQEGLGDDPFKPKAFRGNYLELWDKASRSRVAGGVLKPCVRAAVLAPGSHHPDPLGSHPTNRPLFWQVVREAYAADLLFDQFLLDR